MLCFKGRPSLDEARTKTRLFFKKSPQMIDSNCKKTPKLQYQKSILSMELGNYFYLNKLSNR